MDRKVVQKQSDISRQVVFFAKYFENAKNNAKLLDMGGGGVAYNKNVAKLGWYVKKRSEIIRFADNFLLEYQLC